MTGDDLIARNAADDAWPPCGREPFEPCVLRQNCLPAIGLLATFGEEDGTCKSRQGEIDCKLAFDSADETATVAGKAGALQLRAREGSASADAGYFGGCERTRWRPHASGERGWRVP